MIFLKNPNQKKKNTKAGYVVVLERDLVLKKSVVFILKNKNYH